MIGRVIGNYRIEKKLGGGGMGVVYRAHDEKLNRTVALKFLPEHLAGSAERKRRFIREARAASALDHPNVCTVYDIGETEAGQLYIVMSYCNGVPLDARIAAGAMPIESCVAIAQGIARGLESAHAAGIIHRDIKPGNIIVADDDAVKIVDFGLAKLSGETALTRDGTTVGTAAYMSPEQAQGGAVDHCTDIWSLGAVLYEMVSGRQAFAAEHDAARIYRIVNEEPPPVQKLRPEVPDALAAVIHRMLEKDPAARFASIPDVLAALHSPGPEPVATPATGDALARARRAFESQDWQAAYEAFRSADAEETLSPEDLETFGAAAQWTSNTSDLTLALERAHAAYSRSGRPVDAARVAVNLAHAEFVSGRPSVCNGWLKRAETLLRSAPDVVENGYLARQKAQVAIEGDLDLDAALAHADRARRFAERYDDQDLLAYAMQDRGRALVLKDQVREGMALVEEAMSLAMSGVVDPMTVGSTYCNLISMCDRIADYRRAGEWSDNAIRWCSSHSDSPFPGICSIRRADVKRVLGAWEDAETELEQTIEFCQRRHQLLTAEGCYVKGQIKLRRGDLDEAEACFREAHRLGRHPVPGLALLRAVQGRVDDARSLIDRALDAESIALQRIRLLPAGVEIALAASDVDTARARAEELDSLASRYESAVFHGQAAHALGSVALAAGDADAALAALGRALPHWKRAEMPYEEARSRVELALAYRKSGDSDLATLELDAARRIFTDLGAHRDAGYTEALFESD